MHNMPSLVKKLYDTQTWHGGHCSGTVQWSVTFKCSLVLICLQSFFDYSATTHIDKVISVPIRTSLHTFESAFIVYYMVLTLLREGIFCPMVIHILTMAGW